MNARRIVASLVIVAMAALCGLSAYSASYSTSKIMLFNGATVDSGGVNISSPWFNVANASHISLRSWSQKAAFVANTDGEADSAYTDSIAAITVLFSDSVSFMARDSAGTRVTSSSQIPRTTAHGEPYPICVDTTGFTITAAAGGNYGGGADTLSALVAAWHLPLFTPLRSPANGAGITTLLYPTVPAGAFSTIYGDGEIHKKYAKIVIRPVKRATAATVTATVPNKTIGLKGFKMEATMYYQTQR